MAVVVLSFGQLMVVLDSTVVNVALPTIQRELHFSQASLAWVVNAYLITFGGLLLLAGRLGDLLGRKRVLLFGFGAFVASSLLCGLSQTSGMLIAARFLQGASAACLSSMVLGSISPMFPDTKERTRALSIFAAVTLAGSSLGLPIGGLLIEVSWHWIFFINLPVGIIALILAARLLEDHAGLGIRAGADVGGALLVTAGPMVLVYALIESSTVGWASLQTIGLFAAAVVIAFSFLVVESRVRTPLIPLHIFRHRTLATATTIRFVYPMGAFAMNFLGSQFLQFVLGFSALKTGLAFLPNSFIVAVISLTAVPRLLARTSPKPLILVGLVSLIAGLFLWSQVPDNASYVTNILPALVLIAIGFGLVFTPTVGVALSDVAPKDSGLVSAITNVSVQMGGSIGIALLASVAATRTSNLVSQHVPEQAALGDGYRLGFLVATGMTGVALVIAAVLLRKSRGINIHTAPIDETETVVALELGMDQV